MDTKSIIRNKRDKGELNKKEIRHFVSKYNKDIISDIQASALVALISVNGLTEKEMVAFTEYISETGEMMNLGELSKDIIDIHYVGGMNEKASIILSCALASLGVPIAKVSGRERNLIDKMQSIQGYDIDISIPKFKENISKYGIGIIAEPKEIAPVENKIYKIRNQIGCMDSIPLTAIGIMSTKVALGINTIIFNIPFGKNTYIKTKDEAKRLSKFFILIGKYFNKVVKCIITEQNEPLGCNFGNITEIDEVIKCLKGNMPEDIKTLVLEIGNKYLSLTGKGINSSKNKELLLNEIESGRAYEKFVELIKIQGGDEKFLNNIENTKKTKIVMPVFAENTGYIKSIDLDICRSIAIYINAIRDNKQSELDIGAGISFNKKIGDKVEVGEILAYIHTNDEEKVKGAVENLSEAFEFSKRPVEKRNKIIDIIE